MNIDRTQYISNIRENATNLLAAIDQRHPDFIKNKNKAAKEYKQYLTTLLENPMMTAIVMNDVIKQNPIKYNVSALHLIELEKQPEMDTLVKGREKLYLIYEKTGRVRNAILDHGRINPETVTPKLTGLKKILFKLKAMI